MNGLLIFILTFESGRIFGSAFSLSRKCTRTKAWKPRLQKRFA
jgi:hypothetical protein